jgi:hypothetical protein
MLGLDHAFFLVDDLAGAAGRLEADGWVLDSGRRHAGQGTRNRRLRWRERFFELLWLHDEAQARANALRLDRRAHWRDTDASPVGLALRGPARTSCRRSGRMTRSASGSGSTETTRTSPSGRWSSRD